MTREVWGILGGVGPLASAAFLATIYEQCPAAVEQELPTVLLLSDPTIPDRTEALLNGRDAELAAEVTWRARRLLDAGATRLILCCVSLHPIVPLLPITVRQALISLVDTIVDAVEPSRRRHLLLCTEGTRRTEVFQRHERWPRVQDRIVFPDDRDQQAIHRLIYRVKQNDGGAEPLELIAALADRYGVDGCIAGCTEMHLLARRDARHTFSWIDPLTMLAAAIGRQTASLVSEPARGR
jgi:aspartate racemase